MNKVHNQVRGVRETGDSLRRSEREGVQPLKKCNGKAYPGMILGATNKMLDCDQSQATSTK